MPRWTICVNELFKHRGLLTSSEEPVTRGPTLEKFGKRDLKGSKHSPVNL